MDDYYSILARAVSRLATNSTQVRQELYEHARTVFTTHMLSQDQHISALETIGERVELETAMLRVEAESQSMPERQPETFADNDIPDFASLLREPTLPVPGSNNSLGVTAPFTPNPQKNYKIKIERRLKLISSLPHFTSGKSTKAAE